MDLAVKGFRIFRLPKLRVPLQKSLKPGCSIAGYMRKTPSLKMLRSSRMIVKRAVPGGRLA